MVIDQSVCPACGVDFPSEFRNSITGEAEIIAGDGRLYVQVTFNCENCGEELLLEDAHSEFFDRQK